MGDGVGVLVAEEVSLVWAPGRDDEATRRLVLPIIAGIAAAILIGQCSTVLRWPSGAGGQCERVRDRSGLTEIKEQPTDSAASGQLAHLASNGLAGSDRGRTRVSGPPWPKSGSASRSPVARGGSTPLSGRRSLGVRARRRVRSRGTLVAVGEARPAQAHAFVIQATLQRGRSVPTKPFARGARLIRSQSIRSDQSVGRSSGDLADSPNRHAEVRTDTTAGFGYSRRDDEGRSIAEASGQPLGLAMLGIGPRLRSDRRHSSVPVARTPTDNPGHTAVVHQFEPAST